MSSAAVSSNIIATSLIAEMQHEAQVTRTCLERIPAEKFDWTPPTMEKAELDFAQMDYKPYEPKTTEDLLEFFDKNVVEAIETLKSSPDERFMENWTMRNG